MATVTTRLTPEMTARFVGAGRWPNETFGQVLARAAAAQPEKTAVIDDRSRLSYRQLDRLATRLAAALQQRGIGKTDVVSSILPNRADAVVLFYAVSRLGATLNPIIPIYGAREIRFILRQTTSGAVVVPGRFRGVDFPALIGKLRPDVPSLREVFVVADTAPAGVTAFGELLEGGDNRADWSAPMPVEPNDVLTILYTSGTTADPKGVLHSHNTLLCECRNTVRYHGLTPDEVFVMPSPVGHISGLLYGIMLPIVLGATSVLMERWEPEHFLDLVQGERGTFSAGATPFLQGVVDCTRLDRYDVSSLRLFPCGGADVPPDLIRRAMRRLGVRSGRGYGSTEFPSITSSAGPGIPARKRAETDGLPVLDNTIELRDLSGRVVAAGSEGEVWARGPELFLGYRDATLNADSFDDNGFFCTGDLGVVDEDGYLTITGRTKDIIVRSGEKLSAKEIEDLIFEHPKVRSVAVVPMPDALLGERVCAFVVPAVAEAPPSLEELRAHLESHEISRRKFPERLELLDEMPLTASGKVLKQVLKERIARALESGRSRRRER
jgi:cyclohexanecarboxylate-CoA ligase